MPVSRHGHSSQERVACFKRLKTERQRTDIILRTTHPFLFSFAVIISRAYT